MTQPRVTKRGIGFGYSGFGEATATWVQTDLILFLSLAFGTQNVEAELLAAESRLLARARAVSEDAADDDAAIDEVPRMFFGERATQIFGCGE